MFYVPKWVMRTYFRHLCSKSFPMSFDPYNRPLKIQNSIKTPTLKVGAHLGVWVHYFTFLRAWNVTPGLHSWASPLQALTLVVKPKAKVATIFQMLVHDIILKYVGVHLWHHLMLHESLLQLLPTYWTFIFSLYIMHKGWIMFLLTFNLCWILKFLILTKTFCASILRYLVWIWRWWNEHLCTPN
jgi:hypothetical protein